jgi:hypothetical protein
MRGRLGLPASIPRANHIVLLARATRSRVVPTWVAGAMLTLLRVPFWSRRCSERRGVQCAALGKQECQVMDELAAP